MISFNRRHVILVAVLGCLAIACFVPATLGQQDDDFDDSGFDDSGYSNNQPQSHDAEGSHSNPSNYQPSSRDDNDADEEDDDVDETHMAPQVASDAAGSEQLISRGPQYAVGPDSPRRFYSPPGSVLLANVDPGSSNYNGHGQQRFRRSTKGNNNEGEDEQDIEQVAKTSAKLTRVRRHSKYIGPVYTYVKTDKHARYKWGVKHKVGKHYG